MTDPGNDGVPQHAATEQPFWESPTFRTVVQGVAIDVLVAVCLLVASATATEEVNWWLLLASLGRTVVQALAASVMKRIKPRQVPDTQVAAKGYRLRRPGTARPGS